jgi:L-ascorbate metabolism protein UlaG (beta-lactamase superfamily)
VRLVKFSHACVRVESDAAVLVIDPGTFTEREALDGVDAVLITHEHADHLDVNALADTLAKRPAVQVFTHTAVAKQLSALDGVVTEVAAGAHFEAAGMSVTAHGGWHAEIHPDIPRVPNLGFLVENSLYHPGDSFDRPEGVQIDTLFVPISGPWLKLAESVQFVRAVRPRRAVALHDALLSEPGLRVYDANMQRLCGCDYTRVAAGEPLS